MRELTKKKLDYLLENIQVGDTVIQHILSNKHRISNKIVVWYGRELKNYTQSPTNRIDKIEETEPINPYNIDHFVYVQDWFLAEGVDIMQYDFITAYAESEKWHKFEETNDLKYKGKGSVIFEYEDYTIVEVPNLDLKAEGEKMQHCVGRGSYSVDSDNKILSVRDESNNPHATMQLKLNVESKKWELLQIKGKQNECPIIDYQPIIIKYLIKNDIECDNCSDLQKFADKLVIDGKEVQCFTYEMIETNA